MATVSGTNNTVTGDSVTVSNPLDRNGVPSRSESGVRYTVTSGTSVSHPGDMEVRVNLGAGDDVLVGRNMIWGADGDEPSFEDIDMGSGNDSVDLTRSYAENISMGAGNDTVSFDNSSADNVNMGSGNDLTRLGGRPENRPSDEELAQKNVSGAPRLDLNGGDGVDTLNLQGDWTVTLSSGNVTIDVNGNGRFDPGVDRVTNVFTNDDSANIIGYPPQLSGFVNFGNITLRNGEVVRNLANFTNYEFLNAICFTAGTIIRTMDGEMPIEQLTEGTMVMTRNGPRKLMWIGRRRLDSVDLAANPKLMPVRVPAGSFGNGLPLRDIRFSPQHRVVLRSSIAEKMFGAQEVMVAVKQLVGVNGIDVDGETRQVVYYHLMFENHEILSVEGIEAESLYPGQQAISFLSEDQLRELREIFPDFDALVNADTPANAAMPFLKGRETRSLAARHVKNDRPLYS